MTELAQSTSAGPRPLWRRIVDFPLVAMVMAIAMLTVGSTVASLIAYAIPPIFNMGLVVTFEIVSIPIVLFIYKLLIARLGEAPRDDLRAGDALRLLGIGLLGGLLIFSLVVAVAAVLGVYRITDEGDFSGLPRALIVSAVFPAISEEILFRGVLFRWIEEFGGSWAALLLTSAIFGASHLYNPHASAIAAVGIAFEAGVMLGAAYMLTRSLWLPMGLHAAWNFTQGEIFDVPVSGTPVHGLVDAKLTGPPLLTGGGFGLEASLIAMVIATVFGIWLLWLAIKRGQLVRPWWVRRRAMA